MKTSSLLGFVFGTTLALTSLPLLADEATGKVVGAPYKSIIIDDKGTSRQFNIRMRGKTAYEPEAWRPEVGDEVAITYNAVPGRGGKVVLAVEKARLVKAGPNSVADLKSPITGTIVETGRTGIKVKVGRDQVVKFDYRRGGPAKEPAGWVESVGEKVTITFTPQVNKLTDNVSLAIDKLEKQ